jgi:PPOX class probable F420-dependent enzyme
MSSNTSAASTSTSESQQFAQSGLASFDGHHRVNIESYKRSGDPKRTPAVFVQKNGKLYFQAAVNSWKAKRMIRNPRVRVAPSTFRGDPKGAGMDARTWPGLAPRIGRKG